MFANNYSCTICHSYIIRRGLVIWMRKCKSSWNRFGCLTSIDLTFTLFSSFSQSTITGFSIVRLNWISFFLFFFARFVNSFVASDFIVLGPLKSRCIVLNVNKTTHSSYAIEWEDSTNSSDSSSSMDIGQWALQFISATAAAWTEIE